MGIWNKALTPAEVLTAMNTGWVGNEAGLVAYYKFNQGVANGTNAGVTTLNDLATTVGGANNGTLTNFALTGTTSNWVVGIVRSSAARGNMMSFDGSDDYVSMLSNPLSTATALTIETWVYPITTNTWTRIVDFGDSEGDNMFLTAFSNLGSPRFAINVNNTGESIVDAATPLTLNTWTHIAVTLSGTTATMYINGVQVGQNASFSKTPADLGATVNNWFGRSQYSDPYLASSLDEVRIWNVARTQTQIRENMHLTLSGGESGLVAYYQFNETTGNAIDAVAGNNGTLNGGATRAASTVSVANGIATRQTVSIIGNQVFGNMTVNFTAMSAPAANDEFVTYQLYDRPLNNVSANNTASNYWIVRQFGTQTFSYDEVSMTLPASNVISTTAPASDMKLYKRNTNSANPWGPEIGTGTFADNTTKVINYNLSPSQASFSEFAVASVTSPLPITLLGLKGERLEGLRGEMTKEVKLEWATASEINNKGFEVEVSENGLSYQKIAFVEGKGNSTTVNSYQLAVSNPNESYYRLKQMDFDGKFSYSPIVFVEGMETLNVYPNPNNGAFTISVSKDKLDLPARLLNTQGIEVWRGVQTEVKTNLPAGMYFLHTTVAGKAKVTKVVIQ